jgi:hypothetical protein
LARMALVHRVLPRDPLRADAAEDGTIGALLQDPGVSASANIRPGASASAHVHMSLRGA